MSWLYLPVGVLESLEQNISLDGTPSDMSSSQSTQSKSSRQESRMDTLMTLLYGETSERSQELIQNVASSLNDWLVLKTLSSPPVSPASPSLSLESARGKTTQEICDLTPFALLKKSDPLSSFWKTCEDCSPQSKNSVLSVGKTWVMPQMTLFGTLDEYWQTWPKAGMMLDGECYRRQKWERSIKENGSGYLHLYPTPTRPAGRQANANTTGPTTLSEMIQKLPTPQAHDAIKGYKSRDKGRSHSPANLNDRIGGTLNPDWVELLMGWPRHWTSLEPLPKEDFERWLQGDVWSDDWEIDTPRLTEIKEDRKPRLETIGNGQVPLCAATAVQLLALNL